MLLAFGLPFVFKYSIVERRREGHFASSQTDILHNQLYVIHHLNSITFLLLTVPFNLLKARVSPSHTTQRNTIFFSQAQSRMLSNFLMQELTL